MTTTYDAAHKYQLLQAQKILDLFAAVTGKPAANCEELESWLKSPQGRAVMATASDTHGKIIP